MSKDVDPLEQTKAESIRPGRMRAGLPIGGYELIEVLGEGGMGVVWRAHDPKLDREVAIKVLKRNDAPVALRQRLQREARAMARLKHPNVLTVYDSGTEGDRDYIAMELVDGTSLDDWLERKPASSDVMEALLAAGRGLAAAHRAGLVHRDFKPHNVLRSHDGRVLVTDFGLARGLGDEVTSSLSGSGVRGKPSQPMPSPPSDPLDATLTAAPGATAAAPIGGLDDTHDATPSETPRATPKLDSVLDAPLTQTGALIGTPAYMAPEQFRGAPPDPRTDQFAFCVTAWQAITGERPYRGTTLAELHTAASLGVAGVKTTLPPAVREVLVRGLDPDADRRWPDLDLLLDALEHAVRPRRSRWVIAGAMLGIVGLVAGAAVIARRSGTTVTARPCDPADQAFGEAWSPDVRGKVWKDVQAREGGVSEELFARVTAPFDDFRTRWMHSYDEACRAPADKLPRARLGCLFGARDQVSALTSLLGAGSAAQLEMFDPHGVLPNLALCDGPSPIAPPPLPEAQRPRILAVIANTLALPARTNLAETVERLEQEAAAIGWAPLVPMILVPAGNEYLRRGAVTDARDMFDRAVLALRELDAAGAGDPRLAALGVLGLLEASMVELAEPDSPRKPDELPRELARLVERARAEIQRAGNDPVLAGSLAMLEADAIADLARWTFDKRAYKEALEIIASGRRQFELAKDLRRAASAAAIEAELYLRRGDSKALDDALFVVRSAEEALERAKLPSSRQLDEIRGVVAFARGDYAEAQRRFEALARPRPPSTAPVVTGKVVGGDGKPIANATVVAWVGQLDGDPATLVTDVRRLAGERVFTDAEGAFTLHAEPGAAIVAGYFARRSTPQLVTASPMTLRLEPTTAINGTIEGRNLFAVEAFARFRAGAATWTVRAPIRRDNTFGLGGLPRGTPAIGAIASFDDGTRTVLAGPGVTRLEWPWGRAVEVIVKGRLDGKLDGAATVWVFRALDRATPKTRGEAERLAETSTNVAVAALHRIGSTATPTGREHYARGDHHAVLAGNTPGAVEACVAATAGAEAPVTCVRADVISSPVNFDFADGRLGTDTQPVVIDLR